MTQDQLIVSLEAEQWNQVLALIAEGPFRVVAPIIQNMHKQLQAQAQPTNVVPMEAS